MGGITESLKIWKSLYLDPALTAYRIFMDGRSNSKSLTSEEEEMLNQDLKNTYELLLLAIKEIRKIFEEEQTTNHIQQVNSQAEEKFEEACQKYKLTKREIEIIKLIAQGKSDKAIARDLFISSNTVHSHMSKIFRKLKVNKRIALLAKLELNFR